MTQKEAIRILIQSGQRDIVGSGMGYRSNTDEWREKVSVAIATLYTKVYPHLEFDESVAINLSLKLPSDYFKKNNTNKPKQP